ELEAPLERTTGDAAIEQVLRSLLLRLLAGDRERALLRGDLDVVLAEAGDRHGDAIGVLAGPLDVVRRIARNMVVTAQSRIHQLREAIEADGGAEKGGKVVGTHSHILLLSNMGKAEPPRGSAHGFVSRPDIGAADSHVGTAPDAF